MNKEERVLKTIRREDIDYLPSQINFADRSKFAELSEAFGLSSENDLDDFLENHLFFTFTFDDKPLVYRDIKDEIEKLKKMGYAQPDWEHDVVYDVWGAGIKVGVESFYCSFDPLKEKVGEDILPYMPKRLWEALKHDDLKNRIKYYSHPEVDKQNNFSDWENDLKQFSGDFLVVPSGYGGIYERSYHLLGWEELMTYFALEPTLVEEIMDKITDYKVEVAKKTVEMGFKIAHSGDDLGTQDAGFFSDDMFKAIILPRLKRLWDIFVDAGIPIMFHSCGNVTQYIPSLIDIGLTILEPSQPCMDLEFLKKEYGKDIIFYGGIDTQKLPFLSPEETKEMVRNTIRTLGKNGGYIIAPAQEIMNDVPLENVVAMIETIREERGKVLN